MTFSWSVQMVEMLMEKLLLVSHLHILCRKHPVLAPGLSILGPAGIFEYLLTSFLTPHSVRFLQHICLEIPYLIYTEDDVVRARSVDWFHYLVNR